MKKSIKLMSVAILVLCLSAFTLNTGADEGYKVGDTAEDFSLKNIDGKMVSLSDYKGAKGFIVTFTCNTCPYAVMYEDRIIALNKKYAPMGYPVIAIMPNNVAVKPGDALPEMKKRAEKKGCDFPYLIDADQTVYPKFGATQTPHVFVLEKTNSGNIVQDSGAIDDNYKDASVVRTKYEERAVDALLGSKEIKEKATKAIGCSIKV